MAEIPSPLGNVTVINGYFPQGESRDHPIKFPAKAQFYQNLQNYPKPNSSVKIRC